MFENMLEFIESDALAKLSADMDAKRYSQTELLNVVLSGKLVRNFAPCKVHGGNLCLAIRALIPAAGPPCVDW